MKTNPAYLCGLREGLTLRNRHHRMHLGFAFVMGVSLGACLFALLGGAA